MPTRTRTLSSKRTRSKNNPNDLGSPKNTPSGRRTKLPRKSGKDHTGRFVKGNQWWKKRSSFGPTPKFTDPDKLIQACEEYFEYVDKTPLYERRVVGQYYGEPITTDVPKMRPMTLGGLQVFLGIGDEAWARYRVDTVLAGVVGVVEKIIRDQKFAGASAGFFNAMIISRDLGLVDRGDVTSGNEPIQEKTVVILPAKLEEPE